DYHLVMFSQKNIILAHFEKVFGVDIDPSNTVEINNITDYYLWNTIRLHNFDQKSIAQEIKDLHLYSEKTKGAMGKQMKKVSAMIQAYLNQSHNTDQVINQIKELIG
ncbi:MAG: hypothetical protein RR217_04700, partial [Mucinivorans sp.]